MVPGSGIRVPLRFILLSVPGATYRSCPSEDLGLSTRGV